MTILEYIGSIDPIVMPDSFALISRMIVSIGTETVPIEIPIKIERTRKIPAKI
jgi:hypothetical protein